VKNTTLMHGTEGFKSLETAVKALLGIIRGCGVNFAPLCNPQLLDLCYRFLTHSNRFVRENGYYICGAISEAVDKTTLAEQIGPQMAPKIVGGLTDEWSQVSRAAAVAVRSFMTHLSRHHLRLFWKTVVPAMCFHRHNPAEGIKVFSQETWRQVMKNNGKNLTADFMNEVVEYYSQQGLNDGSNPLREAACLGIGELATKIDQDAVRNHIHILISTLMHNMEHQNSWAIVDAACLSATDLILNFPHECRSDLPSLVDLLFENLSHVVWSVRENAAIALGAIASKFPDLLPSFQAKLSILFARIGEQPADEHIDHHAEGGHYGPKAKKRRDNDPHLHRKQEIFGCDCHSTRHQPGCSSHDIQLQNTKQPWHYADGAIYLLRELLPLAPSTLAPLVSNELVQVAKAPNNFHYHHHLMETLWRQLPRMIAVLKRNGIDLGSDEAKSAFAEYLSPLGASLKSGNRLAMSSGAAASAPIISIVGQQEFVSQVALHKKPPTNSSNN
jgi:hypothetical protein